jgi:hypothetical protein
MFRYFDPFFPPVRFFSPIYKHTCFVWYSMASCDV